MAFYWQIALFLKRSGLETKKRQEEMVHSQYQSIQLNRITPFKLDIATITFSLTSAALLALSVSLMDCYRF